MDTPAHKLEQRIRTDYGLAPGEHLVRFVMGELHQDALVRIPVRGRISYVLKPTDSDMYSGWRYLNTKGRDAFASPVKVWGAQDPEYMQMFAGDPVATISLRD